MTEKEIVERIRKGCEAEHLFPGVLGNPVTFAARWGLPLSKGYLRHLARRRSALNGRSIPLRTPKPSGHA
ncbi:MAG: hypothetical protein C5B50_14270 [Verrucomicrobia bacterium]|nr:MAG: hypothetical protein C5B50_14270 [Verrucomicrobiota bacterium]